MMQGGRLNVRLLTILGLLAGSSLGSDFGNYRHVVRCAMILVCFPELGVPFWGSA